MFRRFGVGLHNLLNQRSVVSEINSSKAVATAQPTEKPFHKISKKSAHHKPFKGSLNHLLLCQVRQMAGIRPNSAEFSPSILANRLCHERRVDKVLLQSGLQVQSVLSTAGETSLSDDHNFSKQKFSNDCDKLRNFATHNLLVYYINISANDH